MDYEEIQELLKQGKTREEIMAIYRERNPEPRFQKTHRGITLRIGQDYRVSGGGWVSGFDDDRLELGMEYLAEIFKKEEANNAKNAELANLKARNRNNATKYTDEIMNRIIEIVQAEKSNKSGRHPALKRSVDRINEELKDKGIRIEDSPSLSNLLAKFKKKQAASKK